MSKAPFLVARRGVSASCPENTLAAFRAAVDLHVDWIELDVLTTADDTLIVSHDRTVDRCTNGTGRFKQMTFKQVRATRRRGLARFAGEHIPTRDEVITLVEPSSTHLCIEIHGDAPDEYLANALAAVTLLQERDFLRRASIASFDPVCLRAVREWEPLLTVNLDGQRVLLLHNVRRSDRCAHLWKRVFRLGACEGVEYPSFAEYITRVL